MRNLWVCQVPLLGRCGIEEEDGFVVRILLGSEAVGECRGVKSDLISETACQLAEYAEGRRRCFTIPLRPAGTPFQQKVWSALQSVPWGEFRTYGQLAAQMELPGGARAVGNAVGANPVPIVIPCHRVLAAGGKLGGFRLGNDLKRKLLELEQIKITTGK